MDPCNNTGIDRHQLFRDFGIVKTEGDKHGTPALILEPGSVPCTVTRIADLLLFAGFIFLYDEIALTLGITQLRLGDGKQPLVIRQPFQPYILQADNKILLAFKIGRQIRLSEIFLHLKWPDDIAGIGSVRFCRDQRTGNQACQHDCGKQKPYAPFQL